MRGKIFLSSGAAILIMIVASGLYLENRLRDWYEERIESELTDFARLTRQQVECTPRFDSLTAWDALADSIGGLVDVRVTIISGEGVVFGDTELNLDEIRAVENHRNRSEIHQALTEGRGVARRYSTTLGTDMLYLALPWSREEGSGVVRVSRPLTEVHTAIGRFREFLAVAGLLGVILALLVSWVISRLLARTLLEIADGARSLASGEMGRRLLPRSRDELGGLAGSINQIAEELEHTVSTLSDERNRFQAVLDSMHGAVIALDADQRITMVNPRAMSLLSLKEEPVGRTLLETVRSPDLDRLVNSARAGTPAAGEIALLGDQALTLLVRATPLDVNGGAVLVLIDVTELRRLERIRRDFLANVSHELRTPVSVIRANAETLIDGALDDREHAVRFIGNILNDAERLSNLVDDLLDLSRLESDGFQAETVTLQLQGVLQSTVRSLGDLIEGREHELIVGIPDEMAVTADPQGIEQIFLNLLDNAIKFTPEGGKIIVRAENRDGEIRIEVIDNGPGIELRHRDRIFERFYRIDEGRSREAGGTGLGLSIVRHLAEAMGGRAGFEPAPDGGSLFWFTLPVA